MPPLWTNFYIVVAIQFVLFCVFAVVRPMPLKDLARILAVSFFGGLALGILFDFVVGQGNGVFSYYLPQTWKFSLMNGVLSYGAALATAALFPAVVTSSDRLSRPIFALGALLLLADLGALYVVAVPFIQTVLLGMFLVLVSELLCLVMRLRGPLLSLVYGIWKPFLFFWAGSALVAAVYEAANFFFPVWIWDFADWIPTWKTELLMAAVGYMALMYTLVLFWQVLLQKRH